MVVLRYVGVLPILCESSHINSGDLAISRRGSLTSMRYLLESESLVSRQLFVDGDEKCVQMIRGCAHRLRGFLLSFLVFQDGISAWLLMPLRF